MLKNQEALKRHFEKAPGPWYLSVVSMPLPESNMGPYEYTAGRWSSVVHEVDLSTDGVLLINQNSEVQTEHVF